MTIFLRRLLFTIAVVASVGFIDASYLTLQHYIGFPAVCLAVNGCEVALTSSYAILFGVPTALFGVLYYAAMFLFALLAVRSGRRSHRVGVALGSLVGLFASAWFVYLQLWVIGAICLWCMFSAGTSLALFLLSLIFAIDELIIFFRVRLL